MPVPLCMVGEIIAVTGAMGRELKVDLWISAMPTSFWVAHGVEEAPKLRTWRFRVGRKAGSSRISGRWLHLTLEY